MNRIKWNLETAKQFYLEKGFILDENEYINSATKMNCHDNNGFKYQIRLGDLQSGRHPRIYSSKNPYSIENLQNLLNLRNSGTIVLSKEYISTKKKILFQCSCGVEFSATYDNIRDGKSYCNYCSRSKRYDGLKKYTMLISEECKKRNYTLLSEFIHRSTDIFLYICNKHKEYGIQQSYYDRFINVGQGCYYCGIEKRGKNTTII